MSDCLFCQIVAGKIPAQKIYEDDVLAAFLDIRPTSLGHFLVVPKRHSVDFSELPEEEVAPLFSAARRLARSAQTAVGATGFNLIVNTGSTAGQVIFHTHLHVIPRFADDGLQHWPGQEPADGELEKTASKIRREIE